MNPTSIATVSLSGDLADKLRAIAAAGFDGVEVFENDFLTFDGNPRDVGKMIADLGLAIVAFQPFRDFEGMPEPLRGRTFERARRKFELMNELGARLMLICSNVSPQSLGGIDRAAHDGTPGGRPPGQAGARDHEPEVEGHGRSETDLQLSALGCQLSARQSLWPTADSRQPTAAA